MNATVILDGRQYRGVLYLKGANCYTDPYTTYPEAYCAVKHLYATWGRWRMTVEVAAVKGYHQAVEGNHGHYK